MNVETIWEEYQSNLKAFLYKNINNQADVDDLLQEILIKTYQNLHKVNDAKKVKSWLFQIANNSIIDFYRKSGKDKALKDNELWYNEPQEDVYQQMSQCVMPFINGLNEADKALLTAIEIEGLSQKAYAEKMGVKYSTLKSQVQKSRSQLYALFNQCCHLSLDKKGNLIDIESKTKSCNNC